MIDEHGAKWRKPTSSSEETMAENDDGTIKCEELRFVLATSPMTLSFL